MTNYNSASFGKIVNPDFAIAALHGSKPHGEFKAFVRMAKATSDKLVSIPCRQIEQFIDDSNILSIELMEYVS